MNYYIYIYVYIYIYSSKKVYILINKSNNICYMGYILIFFNNIIYCN